MLYLLGWVLAEFPPREEAATQQRLDELFYSVKTLHLNKLEVSWGLVAFQNLIERSLSFINVSTEALGQILSTNPKLQYIRLENLRFRKTSTTALPPTVLIAFTPLGFWISMLEKRHMFSLH